MVPPTGSRRVRDTKTRRVYTDRTGRCVRRATAAGGPSRRIPRLLMGGLRRTHRSAGPAGAPAVRDACQVPRRRYPRPRAADLARRWWWPWRSASSWAPTKFPTKSRSRPSCKPDGRTLTFLVRAPLKAMRDIDVPVARERVPRPGPGPADARRRRHALDWRLRRAVRERPAARPAADHRRPRRRCPRTSRLPATTRRGPAWPARRCPRTPTLYWQDGLLDVAFAYDIQSDQSRFAIQPGPDPARPAGQRRDAAASRPATPSAPSTSTATRASSSSIRAGTRRRCASSRTASSTSSTASTTCCSCSAW